MELIHWALDHTAELLKQDNTKGWTGHWLEVLKEENAKGFHPTLPEFGFGDPTSYKLIEDVVRAHISPISPLYLPYISLYLLGRYDAARRRYHLSYADGDRKWHELDDPGEE